MPLLVAAAVVLALIVLLVASTARSCCQHRPPEAQPIARMLQDRYELDLLAAQTSDAIREVASRGRRHY